MIEPTIGRVVWYHPVPGELGYGIGPLAAIIVRVWSDYCVNLTVFDQNGDPHGKTSVALVQDDEAPMYGYAEWMPYQKGQADKTEAMEARAEK